MQNQSITIANTTIHQDVHGRFCLNDLHKAAGNEPRHRPSRWLENQQTKEAVEELFKAGIPALVSVHGGNARGTYVCRVLVYSYAMWISAKFYLKVIHAYDELVTGQLAPPELTVPPFPPLLTPEQYEAARDQLDDMQDRLAATPITILPAHYEQLTGEHVRVAKKTWLIVDLVALFEEHDVPREVTEKILGINNNTIRQHAFRARKHGQH